MLLSTQERANILPIFIDSLWHCFAHGKKTFTAREQQLFCIAVCETLMRSRWSTAQSNPELCSGQAVPQMLRLQNPTLWVFSPGVEVSSDHMGRYKRAAQSHSAKRYTRYDTPRPLSANALSLMTELAELGSDVSMNYLLGKQGTKLRNSSGSIARLDCRNPSDSYSPIFLNP